MATRFDSFSAVECGILAGSLAVYRDSYSAAIYGRVNGVAPSRDALLTELAGATNWPGKHADTGVNLHPGKQ